jgi:PKD repeat protein
MKNILPVILLPACLFLLMSCAKVDEQERENVGTLTLPIASFYVSGNEGPAPATVQFHNTSEYSDQWVWTFHNGATSGQFEPSFTYYNNTGEDKTFLVTLKAIDSNTGEFNIRSKSILIHPSK